MRQAPSGMEAVSADIKSMLEDPDIWRHTVKLALSDRRIDRETSREAAFPFAKGFQEEADIGRTVYRQVSDVYNKGEFKKLRKDQGGNSEEASEEFDDLNGKQEGGDDSDGGTQRIALPNGPLQKVSDSGKEPRRGIKRQSPMTDENFEVARKRIRNKSADLSRPRSSGHRADDDSSTGMSQRGGASHASVDGNSLPLSQTKTLGVDSKPPSTLVKGRWSSLASPSTVSVSGKSSRTARQEAPEEARVSKAIAKEKARRERKMPEADPNFEVSDLPNGEVKSWIPKPLKFPRSASMRESRS